MKSPKLQSKDSVKPTPRQSTSRTPLTQQEVETAFRDETRFPPILSLDQASTLAHLAPSTLKRLVSQGFFAKSARRGKPIAFWRDRFVIEAMELDKTRKWHRNFNAKKRGDQQ